MESEVVICGRALASVRNGYGSCARGFLNFGAEVVIYTCVAVVVVGRWLEERM